MIPFSENIESSPSRMHQPSATEIFDLRFPEFSAGKFFKVKEMTPSAVQGSKKAESILPGQNENFNRISTVLP